MCNALHLMSIHMWPNFQEREDNGRLWALLLHSDFLSLFLFIICFSFIFTKKIWNKEAMGLNYSLCLKNNYPQIIILSVSKITLKTLNYACKNRSDRLVLHSWMRNVPTQFLCNSHLASIWLFLATGSSLSILGINQLCY